MNNDLTAEVVAQRESRKLSPALVSLVRRSSLMPETAVQRTTLYWLQGQTPEERAVFTGMLERIEAKADFEADDEALVDEILAEEARRANP